MGFNGFADFQSISYDQTDLEDSDNVDMEVDDDDDDNNIGENQEKNSENESFRGYKNRLFFNKKYH